MNKENTLWNAMQAENNVTCTENGDKAYKSNRNIKEVTSNAIGLSTGKHFIEVVAGGEKLYSKWIFVSAGEHKIIEL